MDVLVGVRVVRGPNWTWGEQDGGEGHVGTVAEVLKADRSAGAVDHGCSGPCIVTVQWDCGNRCRYRCGVGDRYDLRVLDSAPAGIKHHRIMCSACALQLTGMRWKCIKCGNCDLCTFCYMSGQHELDHDFERMDTPGLRVRIPTRVSSKKKEARGIYQNAEVMPGRDWIAPASDQGMMDDFVYGEVVNILGADGDNSRGFAEVKWSETQHSTIHRVGYEGKVELRYVEPSCVSYYYPDHLPDLGAPAEESEIIQSHDISPGDYVIVKLDPEVFRAMHEGSEQAGWDDHMMEILGETGRVQRVYENGDLRIMFPMYQRWTISAEAVTKEYDDLPQFSLGDTVTVIADDKKLAQMITIEPEIGHYFSMFYGERCRVVKLLYKGFVTVATKQKIWCFPPIFLIHEDDLSTLPWPNPLTKADNLEALRSFLKQNPSQVDKKLSRRTALHCAAVKGNSELVKLLLEFGANKEMEDDKTYRPLHYAILVGSTAAAEVLISAGADVNSKGYNGNTPLILAANKGHAGIAKLLLKHPHIKVNEQDADGNTALHVAVLTQQVQVVSLLMEAGADPSLINFRIVTPIFEAARIGFTAAVNQMILYNPESAKVTNDYLYNILHIAAQHDHRDIISVAVEKGGLDVDSMDDMGHAPLHFAIENGCLSAIEQLIEYGADVNARDASDRTPLYLTIMYRDTLDVPSNACPKLKRFHEALMGKLADNVNKRYFPMSLLAFLLKLGADMHIETKGQSAIRVLPYLAELMTIVAENEEILSAALSSSASTSVKAPEDGILCQYGHRPYIIDSDTSKSSSRAVGDTYSSPTGHGQQSDRPYGSYFSSYGRREGGERGESDYDGRRTNQTPAGQSNSSQPTKSTTSYTYGYESLGGYQRSDSRSSSQGQRQSHPQHSSYSSQQTQPSFQMNSESERGYTAIHLAALQGQADIAKLLISGGAKMNDTVANESAEAEVASCFLCESPANVIFHPCGHSVMCSQCAKRAKKCPTCRKTVTSSVTA